MLRGWLGDSNGLSPKTLERYRQLAEQQIIPHLGAVLLQKLRPCKCTIGTRRCCAPAVWAAGRCRRAL